MKMPSHSTSKRSTDASAAIEEAGRKPKQRLNTEIDQELHRDLKALAARRGQTLALLVESVLRDWYAEQAEKA